MSNITISLLCNRMSTIMYKMMHSFFVCISCKSDNVVNANANMKHLLFIDEELSSDGSDNGHDNNNDDTMVTAFI